MLQSELSSVADLMFSALASAQSVGQIPILISPDFTVKMQKALIIEIICAVRQNANRTVLLHDEFVSSEGHGQLAKWVISGRAVMVKKIHGNIMTRLGFLLEG
jgi:hypothetical protein